MVVGGAERKSGFSHREITGHPALCDSPEKGRLEGIQWEASQGQMLCLEQGGEREVSFLLPPPSPPPPSPPSPFLFFCNKALIYIMILINVHSSLRKYIKDRQKWSLPLTPHPMTHQTLRTLLQQLFPPPGSVSPNNLPPPPLFPKFARSQLSQ